MGGQQSSVERAGVPEAAWEDIVDQCADMVEQSFKEGSFIMFLHKQTKELRYAQVDKVMASGKAFVKIADGVFLQLEKANSVWCFVGDEWLEKAKEATKALMDAQRIALLTSMEGVRVIVLASVAKGVFGGAAVTSGLATLGGGSLAAGGTGMAGGIVVIASAPSMLAAHTLYRLSDAVENNSITPTAVALGGLGGAAAGTTVSVVMVSEVGIAGMSAAGITSGLASLGGGTIAAGGTGMLGGLAVVAGVATGITVAIGGAVWLGSSAVVQRRLGKQRSRLLDIAVRKCFQRLV